MWVIYYQIKNIIGDNLLIFSPKWEETSSIKGKCYLKREESLKRDKKGINRGLCRCETREL